MPNIVLKQCCQHSLKGRANSLQRKCWTPGNLQGSAFMSSDSYVCMVKQKYTILDGVLPISFIKHVGQDKSVADKVMVICCALVNLCESIVPTVLINVVY